MCFMASLVARQDLGHVAGADEADLVAECVRLLLPGENQRLTTRQGGCAARTNNYALSAA